MTDLSQTLEFMGRMGVPFERQDYDQNDSRRLSGEPAESRTQVWIGQGAFCFDGAGNFIGTMSDDMCKWEPRKR